MNETKTNSMKSTQYNMFLFYMENRIKTTEIKIPVNDVIIKTINQNPISKCDFNNRIVYNFVDLLLDHFGIEDTQSNCSKQFSKVSKKWCKKENYLKGGRTKTKKRTKDNRKTMKYKGGANMYSVLLFISLFVMIVNGVQNKTDADVLKRIKEANEVADLFRNDYGTCSLNTLLFLKTIDLPTFENLSIEIMKTKKGLRVHQISPYLNRELDVNIRWFSFSGSISTLNEFDHITAYIEKLRNRMMLLRGTYGFSNNEAVITAMNYPKKNKSPNHSVVLWLTEKNEIVIIDPQKFLLYDGIVLYTSEATIRRRYIRREEGEIQQMSLHTYVRENIDIVSEHRDTDILESMHIEINDTQSDLSISNKQIYNVISRIKTAEESMSDIEKIEDL